MASLVPIDHDPFADDYQATSASGGVTFRPIDHDPWSRFSNLPMSENIDDRRGSLTDTILTQVKYPMRKDRVDLQRYGDDPIKFPQIAADFPMRKEVSESEGSSLAKEAGYDLIRVDHDPFVPLVAPVPQ